METDSDSELQLTPPSIVEAAQVTTLNLLPETSKKITYCPSNVYNNKISK